jgi:hypothetical protein
VAVPSLIYDVRTQQVEEWPWNCGRVAVSARTNQLALWCGQVSGHQYAVIEWGGEIWYSDSPPTATLTRRLDDQPPTWAWSPDGSEIAYFDQVESGWQVSIADAQGPRPDVLVSVADPRGSPWQLVKMHWSVQGERLLIMANGTADHPCPLYKSLIGSDPNDPPGHVPCWQVMDANTGEVVWSVGDAAEAISSLLPTVSEAYPGLISWSPFTAAISTDGNWVAFSLESAILDEIVAIDLRSGEAFMMDARPVVMRWGQ